MDNSWLTEDLSGPISTTSASASVAGPSSSTSHSGQAQRRGPAASSSRNIDVEPPSRRREDADANGAVMQEDFEEEEEETALAKLMRSWLNERHSPELLAGEEAVVGRLLDHVRKQVCFRTVVQCVMQSFANQPCLIYYYLVR